VGLCVLTDATVADQLGTSLDAIIRWHQGDAHDVEIVDYH